MDLSSRNEQAVSANTQTQANRYTHTTHRHMQLGTYSAHTDRHIHTTQRHMEAGNGEGSKKEAEKVIENLRNHDLRALPELTPHD